MAGRILSVYITNEEIRVCELIKAGGNVTVHKAFCLHTPSGSIEDGQILDVEELAVALQEGFQANGIKKGKLAFVISSRKIANKEIVIPFIRSASRVEEIIQANLTDYFPMNNLEDYTCKHTILDTFENAEGKHYSVLVMAIHRRMIQGFYELAAMMKMPVEAVDYYGNSIYQLLKKQLNQGTVLGLQMDKDITYVSIMRGQAQLFRRSIPYGRDTIIQNLALYRGLTEKEAEDVLSDPQKLDSAITVDEYVELVSEFAAAISRVVDFHTSRNPGIVIEIGKLMGSGVGIIGFAEVLSKALGIEIQPIKEITGVKISKKNLDGLNYENIVDYLPNIGFLFKPLKLKNETEKKEGILSGYLIYYILMIVAAVVSIALCTALLILNHKGKEEKAALEAELSSMEEAEAFYLNYNNAQIRFNTIQGFYDQTVNDTEALYEFILKLEEVMPKSVGINNFTISDGAITMNCISAGKEAIAAYVIELKKIEYVTNVRVQNISDTYGETGQVTSNFNISLQISVEDESALEEGGNAE